MRSARVPPRHPDGTAICQWRTLHWQIAVRRQRCGQAGYAATATPAELVLDGEVVTLKREPHALLGELVRLGVGVRHHRPAGHVG